MPSLRTRVCQGLQHPIQAYLSIWVTKGPVPQVAGSIDLSQVRRGRGRAPQKTVRPTPTPCPVTWLETLHNQFLCAVIFLDETESLVRVYERESQDDISDNPSPQDNPPAATPRYVELPSIDPLRSFPSPASPLFPRLYSQTSAETPSSPTKRRKLTDSDVHYSPTASHHSTSFDVSLAQFTNPQDGLLKSPNENRSELHSSHTNVDPGFDVSCTGLSPTYVDIAVWPLGDIKEAKLMRYFVDHLSVWFDLCDPLRSFATLVPQRAAICPPLLYAVFAVSARHLNRISSYDPYAADRYYEKCLNHLKQMMYDEVAIMDENLLAATVILRWLEEVDVPLSGSDLQSHLVGTKALIDAQENSIASSGLRQAAFWVALRQEIYIAFFNQRTVHWNLDRCNIDRSLDLTDDCTHANRIIVHCAEVLQYCFGSNEHSVARWEALKDYGEGWNQNAPPSFSPIFFQEPIRENGEVLPQIWHICDSHVTGIQHYILSSILLAVYNPKLPRLGPGQRAALKTMDDEIKSLVKTLAGLAVSNDKTPPHMVTACIGISMAGDRFTERSEQETLLDVLVRTEKEFAWPTDAAQKQLREAWRWDIDE
ncbi:hypothetical protein MMC24_007013 [Lignoscripta atroalba]|nr:hypothetical protein [Lignoscripta atroalba]